jgi:hypothetical protein
MRHLFVVILILAIPQVKQAQPGTSLNSAEVIVSPPTSNPKTPDDKGTEGAFKTDEKVSYLDYKSVYEAESLEEEVKMATERFKLSPAQKEIWEQAAIDRRLVEKQASEKLDANKSSYEKEPVYRGLRTAQNTFHATIVGHLTPAQKQAFETDRLILQEKQQRLAKLPPPPAPIATVTVVPIDSVAIKEKEKTKSKSKAKKRKK